MYWRYLLNISILYKTIFDFSKQKLFADNNFDKAQIALYVFEIAKNIVGNEMEKCWLPRIFFFSEGFFPGVVNPFPNKPWFFRVCNRSILKTQWEKEKLLVTSNSFLSHSVLFSF